MRKIWPFTFNIFMFAGFAFVLPFLVLYYQSRGFSGAQIGMLTGLTPLVTIVCAPLWTALADKTRRHRLIMSLALLVGTLAVAAFPLFTAFAPILLTAFVLNIFFAPVTPLADSATLYMLADQKEMYGRIRLGGTIGFGVASALAGVLVESFGINLAFWGSAALFLLVFVVSQKLVYNPQTASGSTSRGIRVLLANRRWLLFLTLAFAGGFALTATNFYLFPYMNELGASESIMGLALTIGTIAELPVLFFGNRLLQRFKPYGLLMLSMTITGARLAALAASSTPSHVLILQLLGGLTFPAMWIASVAYADQNAPAGLSATAQGMLGAMVFGFGAAVGGFAGGLLLESVGGRGLFFVFGIAVLFITFLVALLQRKNPAESSEQPAIQVD